MDTPPKAEKDIELEKLYKLADNMAVHYHTLHQTCTALLARAGAKGPPYSMQIAAYREVRKKEIKAIEDAVKPTIKTHEPSKVIKPGLVDVNGKKLN